MDWAILILLWTWKCGEDLRRLQEKTLKHDDGDFCLPPGSGPAIAAAAACAAACCF
jgi:hypothetical protein